jgi:hypothetical protein
MAAAFARTTVVRKGEGALDLFRQIGDCNPHEDGTRSRDLHFLHYYRLADTLAEAVLSLPI